MCIILMGPYIFVPAWLHEITYKVLTQLNQSSFDYFRVSEASNPPKRKTRSLALEDYFSLSQSLEEARALQQYLDTSSLGVSVMLGSESLFKLALDKRAALPAMRSELAKLESSIQPAGEDVFTQGKKHVFNKTCTSLQQDIEMTVTAINQRKLAVQNLAGKN